MRRGFAIFFLYLHDVAPHDASSERRRAVACMFCSVLPRVTGRSDGFPRATPARQKLKVAQTPVQVMS